VHGFGRARTKATLLTFNVEKNVYLCKNLVSPRVRVLTKKI